MHSRRRTHALAQPNAHVSTHVQADDPHAPAPTAADADWCSTRSRHEAIPVSPGGLTEHSSPTGTEAEPVGTAPHARRAMGEIGAS